MFNNWKTYTGLFVIVVGTVLFHLNYIDLPTFEKLRATGEAIAGFGLYHKVKRDLGPRSKKLVRRDVF